MRIARVMGEVVLERRPFRFRKRSIVASGDKTPKDLSVLTGILGRHIELNLIRNWAGELRWCINPVCSNAFFFEGWKKKRRQKKWGMCCSTHCSQVMFPRLRGAREKREMKKLHLQKPIEYYHKNVCPLRIIRDNCFQLCVLTCAEECDRFPDYVCKKCPCGARL